MGEISDYMSQKRRSCGIREAVARGADFLATYTASHEFVIVRSVRAKQRMIFSVLLRHFKLFLAFGQAYKN